MQVPLFPLNTVLFPGAIQALSIFEDRYKLMVRRCLETDSPFGIVLIKRGREVGGPAEPFSVGTLARIIQGEPTAEGRFGIICRAEERFRITSLDRRSAPYLVGEVELYPDDPAPEPALRMVAERVALMFDEYFRLVVALTGGWQRETPPGQRTLLFDGFSMTPLNGGEEDSTRPRVYLSDALPTDPTALANTVASNLSVHVNVKQDLLECPSALQRLQKEAEIMAEEMPGLQERLRVQVRRRYGAFAMMN
jgi:hypothetical protein